MTDLNAFPHTTNPSSSVLGRIMDAAHRCQPESTPQLSSNFICIMDQIRLHLENKRREAGWLGPLDFECRDFEYLFDGVQGEAWRTVLEAVRLWYQTIYIRQKSVEQFWRDLYEDETPLTQQQESLYFNNMRSGAADAPRWRDLFIKRNEGLVGHFVKRYQDKLTTLIELAEPRFWKDEYGNKHDGGHGLYFEKRKIAHKVLFNAGMVGLNKAVARFDPSKGWKFSTYAGWWIRGEITNLFKKIYACHKDDSTVEYVPRVAEDYQELNCTMKQAFDRLNDPRKAQIITMRYGLFGGKEHTFKEIGEACGISPQRVQTLLHKTLEQLKQDRDLRASHWQWFTN